MIGTETATENPAGSPEFVEDDSLDRRPEPEEPKEAEPFTRDDFLGDLKRAATKAAKRLTTEGRRSSEDKS